MTFDEKKDDHDLFSCIDGGTPESTALKFEEFHRLNPKVWDYFCEFTLTLIEAGWKRLGSRFILERVRWEICIATKATDGFKINDHYTPFYARKFMKDFPQHDGIFETRRSVADNG